MLIEITVSRDQLEIIRQYQEREGTTTINEAASLLFRDLIDRANVPAILAHDGNGGEPAGEEKGDADETL